MDFQLLAESIPQIVWTAWPDGKIDYFNRRWFDFSGCRQRETYSFRTIKPLLHPEDGHTAARSWVKCLRSGNDFEMECRVRGLKEEEYQWFLIRGVPVRDEQGHAVRWFGTCTRINDQKKNEASLKRREEEIQKVHQFYSLAVKGSGTGIWEWDAATGKCFYSLEWKTMLGCRDYEIKSTVEEWISRLHPEDSKRALEMFERYKKITANAAPDMIPAYELEHRLRHKDGTYRWIHSRGLAFYNKYGKLRCIAGSHVDITNQKNAEQDLQRLARDLAVSNKELEHFASIASHDLQEPLRLITSYLDLVRLRYGNKIESEAAEFLSFAQNNAAHAQQMVHQLLEYARIGTLTQELRPVAFEEVLEQTLSNLKLAIDECGAEIRASTLPALTADRFQMIQLFQNLISNSIRYRCTHPVRIEITAWPQDREWLFCVKDNGKGIEPRDQARIFDLFQRGSETGIQGMGMGLAVCKKIVERHGGRIWIESEKGKGTSFLFMLPENSGSAPDSPAAP
jgi:PAS domain S-box-containing protein